MYKCFVSVLLCFKLKCLVVPVADAVFGGSFGGPIGFVAGLKAAKMAAFGGGLFGKVLFYQKVRPPIMQC